MNRLRSILGSTSSSEFLWALNLDRDWTEFQDTRDIPAEGEVLEPPRQFRGYLSIRSTHCARQALASKGSPKYWVSRATLSPLNSMMLTV